MTDDAARLDRRGAIILGVVALVGLTLAAGLLVPWDWVPGGRLTPMPASELFSREELARAEEFSQARRWISWSSLAVSLAVAIMLGFSSWGSRLVGLLTDRLRWWSAVPAAVFALLVIGRVATLPFSLALRRQSLDYDLTRQTLGPWFADVGRGLLVQTVTTSLALLLMVALARRRPRDWYLPAAALAVLLAFAGSLLYPVVVEPLFNRFTPMAEGPFKASVLRLADREGVPVDDVLVADASRRTTTFNAYVSGIGGTRRVVVYDTLLAGLTPEQARVVVAHELAHAKNHDVLVGTTLGALGGVVGVCALALLLDLRPVRSRAGVDGPADPRAAALVLALVAVGTLVVSPATSAVSRAIEARADRVSLEVTGADAAFVAMQRRLALQAVRDPAPPRLSQLWFGSHPTVLERAGLPGSLTRAAVVSRVLVVTNDFPTRRGGIESFVLSLCERLDPEEVVVYTASMPGDRDFDATLAFPVHRDPSGTLLPTRAVGRRVERVLRETGCDRVLFGASAPLGLLGPRLRRAGAVRLVALTHGHEVWWARVPLARRLLRRIGDGVDVMTYVSEWCRGRIAAALSPAAAARMERLSPGVDITRFHPGCGGAAVRRRLGIAEDAPVVVCTARMVARKGQDTLIRAWPEVLAQVPGARLLLVGDGPYRARLERMTDRAGLHGSVIFTGSVPWVEVPAHTDAGDVFAMPCRTRLLGLEPEAFGIVFLEAQACGLPVLVGDSGGAPETLREGRGRTVDGRRPPEVASALLALLGQERDDGAALAGSSWEEAAGRLRRQLLL